MRLYPVIGERERVICRCFCFASSFKVVQVVPQTQRHLVFLNELMNMPNHKFVSVSSWSFGRARKFPLPLIQVEFWSKPSGIGKPCDILLSPDSFGSITSSLSSHGLGWTVTIQNVEK